MKELTCTNCGQPLRNDHNKNNPQWCDACFARHALAEKIANKREVNPEDLRPISDQTLIDTLRHRGYIVTA